MNNLTSFLVGTLAGAAALAAVGYYYSEQEKDELSYDFGDEPTEDKGSDTAKETDSLGNSKESQQADAEVQEA